MSWLVVERCINWNLSLARRDFLASLRRACGLLVSRSLLLFFDFEPDDLESTELGVRHVNHPGGLVRLSQFLVGGQLPGGQAEGRDVSFDGGLLIPHATQYSAPAVEH